MNIKIRSETVSDGACRPASGPVSPGTHRSSCPASVPHVCCRFICFKRSRSLIFRDFCCFAPHCQQCRKSRVSCAMDSETALKRLRLAQRPPSISQANVLKPFCRLTALARSETSFSPDFAPHTPDCTMGKSLRGILRRRLPTNQRPRFTSRAPHEVRSNGSSRLPPIRML